MMFLPTIKAFGSFEAWINSQKSVLRFLLVRVLLMTAMVLTFSYLYLTHS